ncbi:MAG: glycosyltransferase family 2 protein [Deltaproteobacteria bacterium]|nr:glycosyltransferase family 2 protein [Deltaproteobacteria bacterium]MBN2670649.1 glycosyltransferase family 2 protein [Deltaproteobacteria bacterium]
MKKFKYLLKLLRARFKLGRLFNSAYYKAHNPDVELPALFCFHHFFRIGWKEHRAPSALFNFEFYLQTYPDIKAARVDPLRHYMKYGKKEGRLGATAPPASSTQKKSAGKRKVAVTPESTDYETWFRHHSPSEPELAFQRTYKFQIQPTVSIVVPVYNPPFRVFKEMVESVVSQTYSKWELCLSDSSTDLQTKKQIAKLAASHPKIRYVSHDTRKGISENSNAALQLATGTYVGLLDQDDLLCPDALFEMINYLNVYQNADILYSDEDKISENSKRVFAPHFKPDWSPDTFMSVMYTCHFTVYRKAVIEDVGGFRKAFDGAQDYDLMLRASEGKRTIIHIPRILYHWRVSETSIAGGMDAKNYAVESLKSAKMEALQRRGTTGTLREVREFPGQYCVDYHVSENPKVSIIIPTRDKSDILKQCIDSVLSQTAYKRYEIIVVDNQSEEKETHEYFKELTQSPNIRILPFDEPFNFSRMNNLAASKCTGDYLLFLNNDTEVLQPDWLDKLLGMAQQPHVGAVGAQLLYPGGASIQHCGLVNLQDGPGHAFLNFPAAQIHYFGRNKLDCNWSAVTAACLMVSKKKFLQIKGFDEELAIAYNDVDLCFQLLNAGYYNVCCNSVQLIHYESVSRGVDHMDDQKRIRLEKERAFLYQKNPYFLQYDPFYNRNLHRHRIDFVVREISK